MDHCMQQAAVSCFGGPEATWMVGEAVRRGDEAAWLFCL